MPSTVPLFTAVAAVASRVQWPRPVVSLCACHPSCRSHLSQVSTETEASVSRAGTRRPSRVNQLSDHSLSFRRCGGPLAVGIFQMLQPAQVMFISKQFTKCKPCSFIIKENSSRNITIEQDWFELLDTIGLLRELFFLSYFELVIFVA